MAQNQNLQQSRRLSINYLRMFKLKMYLGTRVITLQDRIQSNEKDTGFTQMNGGVL
jgi:hypothetical protein